MIISLVFHSGSHFLPEIYSEKLVLTLIRAEILHPYLIKWIRILSLTCLQKYLEHLYP